MKTTRTLDFSLLPDLSYTKAWFQLDDNLVKALEHFPNVLYRAENTVKFSWFVSQDAKTLYCSESVTTRLKEGFLRASLAEFASIDDILKIDVASFNHSQKAYKWFETQNPMLHIIHELRNFEIHLNATRLSHENKPALWGKKENPEKAVSLDAEIWTVDEISETDFSKLKNAKYYSPEQIQKLVSWFNSAQKAWGVNDLVFRAVETYCYEIVNVYSLS